MQHKVLSYKDQTYKVVGLKLCSDCLSLSIVLLYKNIHHMKKIVSYCESYKIRGKLQLRCSKHWLKENCGPKSVLAKTGVFS